MRENSVLCVCLLSVWYREVWGQLGHPSSLQLLLQFISICQRIHSPLTYVTIVMSLFISKYLVFLWPVICHLGGSQSRFPARHEAGSCWFDGTTACVCCHGDEDCASATEDPLWRLGRGVWPVGWLRITWPLSCRLVSTNRLPAPTPSLTR